MRTKQPGKRKALLGRRLTAILLIIAFGVSNLPSYSFAQSTEGVLTDQGSHSPRVYRTQTDILLNLSLPPDFGTVEDIHQVPHSEKTVILIQDAHSVPAAQKSLRRLVDFFQDLQV